MKKFLIALVVLSGCYSPRIASKYMDGLYKKNPALIRAKMEVYHRCSWMVVQMTPADVKLADSLFNVKK